MLLWFLMFFQSCISFITLSLLVSVTVKWLLCVFSFSSMKCVFKSITIMFLWWCPWTGVHLFIFFYDNFRHNTATEPWFPWLPLNVPFSQTVNHLAGNSMILFCSISLKLQLFKSLFDMKSSCRFNLKDFSVLIRENQQAGGAAGKATFSVTQQIPKPQERWSGGFLKGSHYQKCSEVQFSSPLTSACHHAFRVCSVTRSLKQIADSALALFPDDCTHMLQWPDSGSQYANSAGTVSHSHQECKMTRRCDEML